MESNRVKDWMTKNPITVSSSVTIPDAYWLMINNKIRRLLVVDDGKLVGIVTIEDLRQKIPFTTFAIDAIKASDILSRCPVRQVMSTEPKTTTPDTQLIEAAQFMLDQKISTLPVMEGAKVVGIITEGDFFRAFVELMK
ncbi:MAG: CBS domain-containing protein [Chloroflexi bacterium]|nr:CBS domain-containing protein [Chloroflexota bacterium]